MRAPLLSFVVVLAIVATVPLVQAQYENLDGKGEEAAAAAGYGPPKKATEKPMEQTVDARATPAMTPNAYNDTATTSGAEVKKEKPDDLAESALPRKVKKVEKAKKEKPVESAGKKEKQEPVYLDGYYLDGSKKVEKAKKEKPVESGKKEPVYLDGYYLDGSKNEKKEKSGEHASGKKEKKEKSISSGGSSAYVKKEEKKSGVDEAVSPKQEKKEKIEEEKSLKKEKKEEEKSGDYSVKKENKEKSVKDATPVAASTDDAYVPK